MDTLFIIVFKFYVLSAMNSSQNIAVTQSKRSPQKPTVKNNLVVREKICLWSESLKRVIPPIPLYSLKSSNKFIYEGNLSI